MDFVIRPLTAADEPLLWEMLYQAVQGAAEATPPPREIVQRPEYARYVEGWGREGDRGYVAHDKKDQAALGAVWLRPPNETNAIPELAFTVQSGHRKRGIGAALLTHWVRANPEQDAVSLKVRPNSPAVRLYERFGFKVAEESDISVLMRRVG